MLHSKDSFRKLAVGGEAYGELEVQQHNHDKETHTAHFCLDSR
jgi:hypothetical protein